MDKQTFRLTDLHEMCFKTTKVVVTNKWSGGKISFIFHFLCKQGFITTQEVFLVQTRPLSLDLAYETDRVCKKSTTYKQMNQCPDIGIYIKGVLQQLKQCTKINRGEVKFVSLSLIFSSIEDSSSHERLFKSIQDF